MNKSILDPALASKSCRAILILLLVIASHWLLWVNNGLYMDGWILYGLYLNNDATSLLDLFRETGNPWTGYFHLAFWFFSNPVAAYKIAAFLSILTATLLVYLLARRSRLLNTYECLFTAAIFACYPAYQAHPEIIMMPTIFLYAVFLLGAYVTLLTLERGGIQAVVLRALSLLMFASSFVIGSLLVFYYPFLILLVLIHKQQWAWKGIKKLVSEAWRYGDYIVLPFIFWGIKHLWIPYGLYANYNEPSIQPEKWVEYFRLFFDGAVTAQFRSAWLLCLSHPFIAATLAACIVAALIFCRKSLADSTSETSTSSASTSLSTSLYIGLFACGLLFCAIFPYVAVGKYATAIGWGTRHSLLIGLPVAVGLIGLGRLLTYFFPNPIFRPALLLFSTLLISAFIMATTEAYVRLQARWIKDESVITNLSKLPKKTIDQFNELIVDDHYRIPSNDGGYDFFSYAGMFKLAWHEETRVGFIPAAAMPQEIFAKKYPLKRYLLKDFHPGGCQMTLHIKPRQPAMNNEQLVMSYFKYRWFNPSNLQSFSENVAELNLTDLLCPATHH